MARRWHRWIFGPVRLCWYWGTHGSYSYGWHWKRDAVCAGRLYLARPVLRRRRRSEAGLSDGSAP